MAQAHGFEHEVRRNGDVVITHHGRAVTILRGTRAMSFLDELENDPQAVMARWTGNFKRGNERTAKQHPRHARS